MTPLQLAILKNHTSMEDLEENGILTLVNRFETIGFQSQRDSFVNIDTSPVNPIEQAAAIVDKTLEDFRIVTPPPTPTPAPEAPAKRAPAKKAPAKKAPLKIKSTLRSNRSTARSNSACLLPTASDPEDTSFVMSLYSESDAGRVNPVHELVRRDVLEIRRTISGKVFFQCRCCKHLARSERPKLSTISPRKVETIYRSCNRFMMEHVSACEHIPAHIKGMDAKQARDSKLKGVKEYWIRSAHEKGLVNGAKNIYYKA